MYRVELIAEAITQMFAAANAMGEEPNLDLIADILQEHFHEITVEELESARFYLHG
jgi:hypothetical protein